jgi:hypothetical protein
VFLGWAGNAATQVSGIMNTAAGFGALASDSEGSLNTAIGASALRYATTYSNTAVGDIALSSDTIGNSNTAVGGAALQSNVTGNALTCIGDNCNVEVDGLQNATAIGANSYLTQSNSLVLGCVNGVNSCFSNVNVGIGTSAPSRIFTIAEGTGHAISDGWDTYSSRRWKTNIRTLTGALAEVERLRGVSYDLKDSGKHEIGVIAEEVGMVVPELVSWDKNGKDAQGVDYSRLTALLIEATKEQQTLIREQQHQIRAQQAQITRLSSQVRAVQATLKKTEGSSSVIRATKAEPTVVRQ